METPRGHGTTFTVVLPLHDGAMPAERKGTLPPGTAFIHKPVTTEELAARIRELVDAEPDAARAEAETRRMRA
jgi:hypothetical protein